jgi:hypothetical protein
MEHPNESKEDDRAQSCRRRLREALDKSKDEIISIEDLFPSSEQAQRAQRIDEQGEHQNGGEPGGTYDVKIDSDGRVSEVPREVVAETIHVMFINRTIMSLSSRIAFLEECVLEMSESTKAQASPEDSVPETDNPKLDQLKQDIALQKRLSNRIIGGDLIVGETIILPPGKLGP